MSYVPSWIDSEVELFGETLSYPRGKSSTEVNRMKTLHIYIGWNQVWNKPFERSEPNTERKSWFHSVILYHGDSIECKNVQNITGTLSSDTAYESFPCPANLKCNS